jgi:hypothetical protein
MTQDYCATSDVLASMPDSGLNSSTDAGYTSALEMMITAASRLIDLEVGRWHGYFYPSTDAETRYYDGSECGDVQDIDDLVTLTSVAVAETGGTGASDYTAWTENTDFYTWPYNASKNGVPIRELVTDYNSGRSGWYGFRKCVKVIGIFGFSVTPPADIQHATIIQTVRWYMRAQNAQQDSGANPNLGSMVYTQQLDPDVREILRHYQLGNMV